MRVSPHKILYLRFLGSYNICIIYLHSTEASLTVAIAMGVFLPFEKTFKCYEKFFVIQSLYIFEKNLLVNKYKKQMCYKKIKSLCF